MIRKKMYIIKTILIIALVGLSCSVHTLYKPIYSDNTGGYYDKALSNNEFYVEFSGNGFTSGEIAKNYLLYRCAEITIENGCKYFEIVYEDYHFDYEALEWDKDASSQARAIFGDVIVRPQFSVKIVTSIDFPNINGKSLYFTKDRIFNAAKLISTIQVKR